MGASPVTRTSALWCEGRSPCRQVVTGSEPRVATRLSLLVRHGAIAFLWRYGWSEPVRSSPACFGIRRGECRSQPDGDPPREHRIVQLKFADCGSPGNVEEDVALDRVTGVDPLKHELG